MIARALDLGDRVFMAGVAASMALVVLIVGADVICRFVFGSSIIVSGELSRLGLVWMTFLVMPLGVSRGLHVAITSVVDPMPEPLRRLVFRFGTVLVLALMCVVLTGAWISIGARSYESLNTLPLTAAAFFWPVLLGAGWAIVHLAVQLVTGKAAERVTIGDLP